MLNKTCIRCKEEKEISKYNKNSASKDGLRGHCRCCQRLYLEERKLERQKNFKPVITEQKCNNCSQIKPTIEFQPNVNAATGFMKECRECKRKKWHEYNDSNPNWNVERKKVYRANGGKEKDLEYYLINKDKITEKGRAWYYQNREKRLLQFKLWAVNNPEKYYKRYKKRKNTLLQADYSWWDKQKFNAKLKELIKEKFELETMTGLPYHIDHVIPLLGKNVCGLHVWNNLQVLSATENLSKGNKYSISDS